MSGAVALEPEPARVLSDVVRHGGSGVLVCVRGKGRRILCLDSGRLAHVASNAIEEQIEEYLVRGELLASHERGPLRAAALGVGKSAAALFAERPGSIARRSSR